MCAVKDDRGFNRKDLRWMGVGVEFCSVSLLFAAAGYGLDKLIDNEDPEFLIVGFLLGFFTASYRIYKETEELRK